MASLVIRFFSSLIPSKQCTNICNFARTVNKIAKTDEFSCTLVYKALKVKFSPILKETLGQIIAKPQNIKLQIYN